MPRASIHAVGVVYWNGSQLLPRQAAYAAHDVGDSKPHRVDAVARRFAGGRITVMMRLPVVGLRSERSVSGSALIC